MTVMERKRVAMPGPMVTEFEPGLFMIDHYFQETPGLIASYLLAGGDDLTLIEAGTTPTLETLLEGVRAAGFDPERITQLVVTHIHLDHAGSAGVLLQRLPQARLFVHRVGAPHLIDPSKLLKSAARIYGDDMDRLWGDVLPAPAERVVILDDGDTIRAGNRTLQALDSPGHASHEMAFHDPMSGVLFTGDIAGVRLGNAPYVRPPTPPPEFDPERWQASLVRLRALQPRRLYLTHFGAYDESEWHFDDLLGRMADWTGWSESRLVEGADTALVAADLAAWADAELADRTGRTDLALPFELISNYQMSVDGLARYFRKRRQAETGG